MIVIPTDGSEHRANFQRLEMMAAIRGLDDVVEEDNLKP